jgi:hypothetical protein
MPQADRCRAATRDTVSSQTPPVSNRRRVFVWGLTNHDTLIRLQHMRPIDLASWAEKAITKIMEKPVSDTTEEYRTAHNSACGEAYDILGPLGQMLSASKSDYSKRYPTHTVVFNGNVCTKKLGKLWFGDIDTTKDSKKLDALAKALGEDVYVLREMDGRFENEGNPLFENAVYIARANK